MSDFAPDNALPTHYRDDDTTLCDHSGTIPAEPGVCPRGCDGASEHYSNDGHRACADELVPVGGDPRPFLRGAVGPLPVDFGPGGIDPTADFTTRDYTDRTLIPGKGGGWAPDLLREVADCVCVTDCAEHPPTACSLSGIPHVHPDNGSGTFGPCPVHPDAPGDH